MRNVQRQWQPVSFSTDIDVFAFILEIQQKLYQSDV